MSSKRHNKLMDNYFKSSKIASNANQFNRTTGKQVDNVPTYKNTSSPNKLEINVVQSIQDKKVQIQESFEQEMIYRRSQSKINKYKGKAKFDKANPRSKSHMSMNEDSYIQRKRSAKRESKERDDDQNYTAFCEKNSSPKKVQNSVNFENSNIKETLVSRKRTKTSKTAEVEAENQREKRFCALPPKSEAEKLLDQQWIKDLPKEVSEVQKDYLLTINDQAERNRELSRMSGNEEEARAGHRSNSAVLAVRKSHVPKAQNGGKFYRYSSGGR